MPNTKPSLKNQSGFTIAEVLVSIIIGLIILTLVGSIFILSQKVIRKNNTKSELTQNGRITIDLMSREIRQAREIVTVLPIDDSSPPLPHELQFEDGHTTSQIQYIRYYLSNNNFNRQIIVYYFNSDPTTFVRWDDIDGYGLPTASTTQDRIIGENFNNINFYGNKNININFDLQKNNEQIEMGTIINPRNN